MRKQLEGGLAVLSLVLGATPKGYSWKEQTHQEHLTAMAVELLELRYENKKQFSELYGDLIRFTKQGAHDEDFPVGENGIRANNHYRHALSGVPLTCSAIDMGDIDVDALSWAKLNHHLKPKEEFNDGWDWMGVQVRGWTPRDLDNGNMSWAKAIESSGWIES